MYFWIASSLLFRKDANAFWAMDDTVQEAVTAAAYAQWESSVMCKNEGSLTGKMPTIKINAES